MLGLRSLTRDPVPPSSHLHPHRPRGPAAAPSPPAWPCCCSLTARVALLLLQADRKLASMVARVRKHLGTTTLALRVWERIQEQLLLRCVLG